MNDVKTNEYQFAVTGLMDVAPSNKHLHDCVAPVVGFTDAKGREYRLVVALEVRKEDGTYEYITSEVAMKRLGFSLIQYDDANFKKLDAE